MEINQESTQAADNQSALKNAAYVVGGSMVLGAVVICAGLVYLAHTLKPGAETALSAAQVGGTAAVAQNSQPAAQAQTAPAPAAAGSPANITLKPNTPYLGGGNAKVTVVEFADYECPFCEQWYRTVWPQLKSKYVDTGEIKFFYQDFSFLGPDSNTAAEAAHCAQDQGKFWQYHDYLFSHQGAEGSGWATADHQKQFAQAVGLNTSQFNQCLDSNKYAQEVQDETAAGRGYGVSGTPTIFVNGTPIVGAQPLATFQQAIDAALKQ